MEEEKTLTLEDLLQASKQEGADLPQLMALLKNGRITSEPETVIYEKQIDPKLHDVMDAQKRPNKKVVVDPKAEDYGEVRDVNPNAEEAGKPAASAAGTGGVGSFAAAGSRICLFL